MIFPRLTSPAELFAGFLLCHVLADFPLQGAYLSQHKCRSGAQSRADWIVALGAHCVIQAGGVWIISGSLVYASAEFLLHGLIDTCKCGGRYGIITDQLLHLACKAAYIILITRG